MTVLEIIRSVREIGFDLRKGRFNGAGWKEYKREKEERAALIRKIQRLVKEIELAYKVENPKRYIGK